MPNTCQHCSRKPAWLALPKSGCATNSLHFASNSPFSSAAGEVATVVAIAVSGAWGLETRSVIGHLYISVRWVKPGQTTQVSHLLCFVKGI